MQHDLVGTSSIPRCSSNPSISYGTGFGSSGTGGFQSQETSYTAFGSYQIQYWSGGGLQQSGGGGMTSQQQMGGGQNMGIPPSSAQQNLSFGGAGMTAMTWIQFQKMGYSQQQQQLQPQMRGQMNFGGNQPGFGSNQGFWTGQLSSGFGASTSSFRANPVSGGSGGGHQQNAGFGIPGGFGAQLNAFGGRMAGMGGAQFGQQQQMQQFGSWQQSQQANPFMNAGPQQAMQRQGQSTNPFM